MKKFISCVFGRHVTTQCVMRCSIELLTVFFLVSAPLGLAAQQASDYRTSISLNLTGLYNRVELHGERRLQQHMAFGVFGAYYPLKHGFPLNEENAYSFPYEQVTLTGGFAIAPYAKYFFARHETDGFYARAMLQMGSFRYMKTVTNYNEVNYQYVTDSTQSSFLSFGGGAGIGIQYAIANRILIDMLVGFKINSLPVSLSKYNHNWMSLESPGSFFQGCINLGYCFK